jgi:hypothetical protein
VGTNWLGESLGGAGIVSRRSIRIECSPGRGSGSIRGENREGRSVGCDPTERTVEERSNPLCALVFGRMQSDRAPNIHDRETPRSIRTTLGSGGQDLAQIFHSISLCQTPSTGQGPIFPGRIIPQIYTSRLHLGKKTKLADGAAMSDIIIVNAPPPEGAGFVVQDSSAVPSKGGHLTDPMREPAPLGWPLPGACRHHFPDPNWWAFHGVMRLDVFSSEPVQIAPTGKEPT